MIRLMSKDRFDEFVSDFSLPAGSIVSFLKGSFVVISKAENVKNLATQYEKLGYKIEGLQLNKNNDVLLNSSVIINVYGNPRGCFNVVVS
jgi:hypothetical protein